MVQLDRGGGRTLYDGRPLRALAFPMRSVGVLLDPLALHPARTVAGHLRLALSADPESAPAGRRERIEAVLDVVGLTDQARTRIFELTEGMTVRLGIAQALLGDPQALLLDEPECGLEPEGRPWLAALLRAYAAQGRCVLVTGQNTDAMLGYADRILVMDAGRLVGQRAARQAARELAGDCVIVRTPQVLRLAAILVAAGAEPTQLDGACLEVRGLDRARIGDLAFRNEVPLHELSVRKPGEDPVVAVLEACRKPPAVVPVQTPPAVRVPEVAQAVVRMPFENAVVGADKPDPQGAPEPSDQREPRDLRSPGAEEESVPLIGQGASELRPQAGDEHEAGSYAVSPFGEGSAVLRVSAVPKSTAAKSTALDSGRPDPTRLESAPLESVPPASVRAEVAYESAAPLRAPEAEAPNQLVSVGVRVPDSTVSAASIRLADDDAQPTEGSEPMHRQGADVTPDHAAGSAIGSAIGSAAEPTAESALVSAPESAQ